MITYRKAKPEDIHAALDLALRVFMEYEAPLYEPQAVESLQADITLKKSKAHIYTIGNRPLFVAIDGECVVGMIDARECGHIQSMYVDGATRHGNDGHTWLQDAWVFEHSCPIEDVRFQEGETCDAMWASTVKIREMMAAGEFLSEWFYPYFEEMVEKWG